MVEKLKTYFYFENYFCGIEHVSTEEGESFILTSLRKKKNELLVDKQAEINSLDELKKHIPTKHPLSIVINTNDVLFKSVESNQKELLNILNQAFPNINHQEFYYEIISQNQVRYVFICRKIKVDSIIERYNELGYDVINFFLGNSQLKNLPLFNSQQVFQSSNAQVNFKEGKITKLTRTPFESEKFKKYDFEGISISNKKLLSFLAALSQAVEFPLKSNTTERHNTLLDTYAHKRFFKLFSGFAIVFILISLLINFLFFNNYYNQVQELKETSRINQQTKIKVQSLNKALDEKKKKVENILNNVSSKTSFYTNEIIISLPPSILLEELNYQPLTKRVRNDKPIEYLRSIIQIAGSTNKREEFSAWIFDLERKNWVNKVEILKFEDLSHTSEFAIKINLQANE